MEILVPLKNLRFGHDAGDINARTTGRNDGIEALSANIFAQARTPKLAGRKGLIENLIVKPIDGVLFAVSNGNRRLAALHMINNTDAQGSDCEEEIPCTVHEVDDAAAFEFSLTTAITAAQLHPVDQYEAFALLKERGNTEGEIAHRYGMKLLQVEQALALAHLSPAVRKAWRGNEIKAEVARAFTLAADHKTQDRLLEQLRADCLENDERLITLGASDIKEALDIDDDQAGLLVEFVGIEAYVKRGGKITRDLFGSDHKVSDEKLAIKMADERLQAECENLVRLGWSFAVTEISVRNKMHEYGNLDVVSKPTDDEIERLAALEGVFQSADNRHWRGIDFHALSIPQQEAYLQHRDLASAIEARAFTPEQMAKSGCFVSMDMNGHLQVRFGKVKPAAKKGAAKAAAADSPSSAAEAKKGATGAAAKPTPVPEPTDISNALRERLVCQLTHGTRDAIVTAMETDMLKSGLAQVLAKIVCAQILPDRPIGMVDAVRTKMHAIREALPANMINNAILKRFDASDYFGSAPKSFVLKAIGEAINPDEARKVSSKPKAEVAKFAISNIGNKIGWVPKEMRTSQYVGPQPTPAAAKAAPTKASPKKAAKSVAEKAKPKPPKKAAVKKAAKKSAKR